ncbi:hypothetical protein LJR034_002985 [Caballeronia sp. LjRoot34]|uniref:hypothetical protein n=1 Tax=Caballeronia sp. LjRoot34 TaxID=3342325 RepID=UPI003ECDC157
MIDRLWALTFLIAVTSDVMSGVIRYYTSLGGAAQVAYLPKILMLVWIVIVVVQRPKVSHVLTALYMAVQACVSLFNGIDQGAVGFWIWTMSPMIFAMLAPAQAIAMLNRPGARIAFAVLAALCIAGVWANYLAPLPWIGTSVMVGGFDVHVAKASFVGEVPRLPGFGRDSAATGLLLGLLTTWLLPRLRSLALTSVLLAASALAIWGTTNKTTLIALAFVVMLNHFGRLPTIKKACIWAATLTVVLPLASLAIVSALNHVVIESGPLSSFGDRMFNTWPGILEGMVRENLIWLGIGPGGFGSATSYYWGNFGFNVSYADNMALYTIANFGVLGAVLLALLLTRFVLSREPEDRPAWLMLFFLLASGVTTDICESIGCLLFFGVTIKFMWIGTQGSPLPLIRSHSRAPKSTESDLCRNAPATDPELCGAWSSTGAKTEPLG